MSALQNPASPSDEARTTSAAKRQQHDQAEVQKRVAERQTEPWHGARPPEPRRVASAARPAVRAALLMGQRFALMMASNTPPSSKCAFCALSQPPNTASMVKSLSLGSRSRSSLAAASGLIGR